MELRTIDLVKGKIKLIDQTKLPQKFEIISINSINDLISAIKQLKVRGAPALGAASALGVYLGIKDLKTKEYNKFLKEAKHISQLIASARPTARNLFWGIEQALKAITDNSKLSVDKIKQKVKARALDIIEEDRVSCRKIGSFGQTLFKNNDAVLTICNTGILATIDYGTALGVIYSATEHGKEINVYACETRPLLQGARLTAWELTRKKIGVTLICDSMAATLMKQGKVDKIIVGADRIALNGDTANKIGTYSLACLAKIHKIPFFVAAPVSTFDSRIPSGKFIPIEQRNPKEVTELFYSKPLVLKGVKVYNPAFDVTPSFLISAIITDKGIIHQPLSKNIRKLIGRCL